MAESPETVWYENTLQGTYHEVVKGTDTEKRMSREQRQVDESTWVPAFRRTSKPTTEKAKKLPGYVAPAAENP